MTIHADELRVVVCDDHALFRRGLVMALDDADDIDVVAEAASGEEAVEVATALAPDVVLMDVRMPGIGGIEAIHRLAEAIPTARILMLSVSDDDDDLFESVKAGAAGYLLKETSLRDIGDAVRAVAHGHSFVSPEMAAKLLEEFALMGRRVTVDTPPGARSPALTAREVQVLEAMAAGADNAVIASEIGVVARVVNNHVRNILEKLQLHSRTEAVLFAIREGVIAP